MFYGHLVHFTVFCYILWTFGMVRGNLVYFFPFWYFVPRKIWQPWRLNAPARHICIRDHSIFFLRQGDQTRL
jgi:hypothetical protein